MELGTAIIGLVVILGCVLPFVIIGRSNKKRKQQILQAISDLAEKHHYEIAQFDIWNNAAIGADEGFNMIFFTKKIKDQTVLQQVNLAEVQECRVINSNRSVGNQEGHLTVVDKLELVFKQHDKNLDDTVFTLYDVDTDTLTLSGELQLADKWCKIARNKIGAFTEMA